METERPKVLEVAKNILIGTGIILLAFVAADVALLKTGIYMTS
jgi:hypothetical protein